MKMRTSTGVGIAWLMFDVLSLLADCSLGDGKEIDWSGCLHNNTASTVCSSTSEHPLVFASVDYLSMDFTMSLVRISLSTSDFNDQMIPRRVMTVLPQSGFSNALCKPKFQEDMGNRLIAFVPDRLVQLSDLVNGCSCAPLHSDVQMICGFLSFSASAGAVWSGCISVLELLSKGVIVTCLFPGDLDELRGVVKCLMDSLEEALAIRFYFSA